LLGDSWFDGNGSSFEERLAEKLPNATIVNRALGGSTSSDVLSSFDANVTNQNPDFVWVSVGINDATSDVLPADYLNNMQILLGKIRAILAITRQLLSMVTWQTGMGCSHLAKMPMI